MQVILWKIIQGSQNEKRKQGVKVVQTQPKQDKQNKTKHPTMKETTMMDNQGSVLSGSLKPIM